MNRNASPFVSLRLGIPLAMAFSRWWWLSSSRPEVKIDLMTEESILK